MNRWENQTTNAVVWVSEDNMGPSCAKCSLEDILTGSDDPEGCVVFCLLAPSKTLAICPRCRVRYKKLSEAVD